MAKTLQVMVVAGEASGDAHAAKLVRALRSAASNRTISAFGCVGPRLREASVETVVEADDLSVVGLIEIASALPRFLNARRRLLSAAAERRPDVAVLVDFPDFNLRLIKQLKALGIPVVYYISPQLWAWRSGRLKSIERYVDLMITILPFEKQWYAERGFDRVEYVGSPLAREVHATVERGVYRDELGLAPDEQLVALLPGSRHKEIVRILPEMLGAVALMSPSRGRKFVIAAGSDRNLEDSRSALQQYAGLDVPIVKGRTYDVLNAADAAVITSGTATLEAGLLGTPMVIVYKTSPLNYALFEPMIDVAHYGLINLIAGKRVARELIQDECNPAMIAEELERLLRPDTNSRVRRELAEAAEKLGHGGASDRAARAILRLLGELAA